MQHRMMKKVLIANRGEIALRIIRTLRECGYISVAVYSEADRRAPYVRFADEAFEIGPAPATASYLRIPTLIDVAKKAKVWAVHPGYGFLAENPKFAAACEAEKIVFLGPSAQTMALMGDKLESRKCAEKAGLPLIAASQDLPGPSDALTAAKKIGYPVLLKARAGGGGKGMREVRTPKEMEAAFSMARSEALKAFANESLYLERYLVHPRHVEIQIFSDQKGNVVALGDRECSTQRRHQKIIEEAPAPHLSPATREKMFESARKLCQAVHYVGAGTVEFLVDAEERFYFLEMNTRLQVEHPVTELTTGFDLVAWQLDVAEGSPLPITQQQVKPRGHAIEVRIYAEDPSQQFFPSPGTLTQVQWPSGPGIRVDSGVEAGSNVPVEYDPLLAKVAVWGKDRKKALIRLRRALTETRISGVCTNVSFLSAIVNHPRFEEGKLYTTFIQDEGPFDGTTLSTEALDAALAGVALTLASGESAKKEVTSASAWWMEGLPT